MFHGVQDWFPKERIGGKVNSEISSPVKSVPIEDGSLFDVSNTFSDSSRWKSVTGISCCRDAYGRSDFAEVSKSLVRHKSENDCLDHSNSYVERSN